jgi:hypothetical protein
MSDNKTLISKYFSYLADGRVADALALTGDDCVFWLPGQGNLTKAGINDLLSGFMSQVAGSMRLSIVGVTAEGDRVAVEAEGAADLKNGRRYENKYHFLFEVKHGVIVAVREYTDTAPVFASLGAP